MKRTILILSYAGTALAVAVLSGYLVVSFMVQHAPEVETPELVGLALSDALDSATGVELDLEVRGFVYSDAVGENKVVSQRPAGGSVVKAGRAVGVILSRGPERHPAPDVVGLRLEDAMIALNQAGLAHEVTATVSIGEAGTVAGQSRTPGAKLAAGQKMQLLLSSTGQSPDYRMPRLEGKTLQQAEAMLARLGLGIDRVEQVKLGDPNRAGRVLSQEPMAGYRIKGGSGVTLSVAGGGKPLVPTRTVWIEQYIEPGLGQRTVEVVVEGPSGPRTVAQQAVEGGATFRRLLTLEQGEKAVVLIDGNPR